MIEPDPFVQLDVLRLRDPDAYELLLALDMSASAREMIERDGDGWARNLFVAHKARVIARKGAQGRLCRWLGIYWGSSGDIVRRLTREMV